MGCPWNLARTVSLMNMEQNCVVVDFFDFTKTFLLVASNTARCANFSMGELDRSKKKDNQQK